MHKNEDVRINEFLYLFGSAIEGGVPSGYVLYEEARAAYLGGDNLRAEKIKNLIYLLHNSIIPYTAEIGKNSVFAYGGIGVIIHANTKAGQRCVFGSSVVIGGDRKGVPKLGHDVYVSTGAKIIGNVSIGDGAIIGANAVVLRDVGRFEVVAGIPGRVVGQVTRANIHDYSGFYWCKGSQESVKVFSDWYFPEHSASGA